MIRMIALAALGASPASAQVVCKPANEMSALLKSEFGETPKTQAFQEREGVLVTQFANEITGTWTLTITGADGETCMFSNGSNWQAVPQGDPL